LIHQIAARIRSQHLACGRGLLPDLRVSHSLSRNLSPCRRIYKSVPGHHGVRGGDATRLDAVASLASVLASVCWLLFWKLGNCISMGGGHPINYHGPAISSGSSGFLPDQTSNTAGLEPILAQGRVAVVTVSSLRHRMA